MKRVVRALLAVSALTVLAPAGGEAQAWKTDRAPLPADSLALARKYTQWFLTSRADSLYAHADSASRARLGGSEAVQQQIDDFVARAGELTEVLEDGWMLRRGATQYVYKARFSQAPEPVVIRFVLNARGEISGLGISVLSAMPPADPKPGS